MLCWERGACAARVRGLEDLCVIFEQRMSEKIAKVYCAGTARGSSPQHT